MLRIIAGIAGTISLVVLSAAPAGATTYAASSNPTGAYVSFTYTESHNTDGATNVTTHFTLTDTRADGQCAHVHIQINVLRAPDPYVDYHVCGNGLSYNGSWTVTAKPALGLRYTVCRWQPGVYQPGCGVLEVAL